MCSYIYYHFVFVENFGVMHIKSEKNIVNYSSRNTRNASKLTPTCSCFQFTLQILHGLYIFFLFPGGSKEITVTFAPDHASDFYSDGVRIELFGQVCAITFIL